MHAAALAEPHGRVLFAGEATSTHPATVTGALESGVREGQRLLQLLESEQRVRAIAWKPQP